MKKLPLYWKIIIGMVSGILFGVTAVATGLQLFTSGYIAPFGTVFINLLKLMAMPLILVSLINGVASLSDISRLSRIGIKTIVIYLLTTIFAVSLGLLLANTVRPGNTFSEAKREALKKQFGEVISHKATEAQQAANRKPLQFITDIVPQNILHAMTDNTKMLQVIFFALLFGIALTLVQPDIAQPLKDFFKAMDKVVLKIIDLIMITAPYGVFALMAGLIVDFSGNNPHDALELLRALFVYSLTVVAGLAIILFLIYPLIVFWYSGISYKKFFRAMGPAQLVAFSTSSSAATLPVTMEQVEKELHVSKEIAGFVLPLGATINMDGTSLYQAVAVVFIAQAMGITLDLSAQLTIILMAVLASIGSAAVPGAGMVMLVIVLEAVGIDPAGIALIFGVDRILDMCRTVVNISGDATCSVVIAQSEGLLKTH
jgi:Na+/H+-dicarboxylate symporter